MDGVIGVGSVGSASVGFDDDASTRTPMSSVSSSSSAYCERLSNAFDGFGGVGFDAASIFLFRRSACGSRAGDTGDTGFGIVDEGSKGPMNG